MAREESKYPYIGYIKTNTQWLDIKLLDPEMEILMKEINEEQQRLKEALREKLMLMKCDTVVLQRENQETREWLRSKGVQLDDERVPVIKEECDIKIKEETIEIESCEFETAQEFNHSGQIEDPSPKIAEVKSIAISSASIKNPKKKKRQTGPQGKRNQENNSIVDVVKTPSIIVATLGRSRRNVPCVNYNEKKDIGRNASSRKRRKSCVVPDCKTVRRGRRGKEAKGNTAH